MILQLAGGANSKLIIILFAMFSNSHGSGNNADKVAPSKLSSNRAAPVVFHQHKLLVLLVFYKYDYKR